MIEALEMLEIANWSRDLSQAEFDRARAGITTRDYAKGSTISEIGLPSKVWLGVVEGLVKIRTLSSDGREASFAGMHAGGWFGEGSVLKGENRRYEIIALRQTRLALMDRETFMWLFDNSLAFNRFLVHQLNERLGQFIAQVEYDRLLSATMRVARTLSLLLNPTLYPNAGNSLKINQEEIGLLAGVTRPVANQALRTLEARGIIELSYAGITINDADALRNVMD